MVELFTAFILPNCALGFVRFSWLGGVVKATLAEKN
jgi:hypothetical protein